MNNFDSHFFNQLAKIDFSEELDGERVVIIPQKDGPRLRVSECDANGVITNSMISLIHQFVYLLDTRSGGRYQFDSDFSVFLYRITGHNLGRVGRKQLHVGFDAIPSTSMFHSEWGCSVGLAFDFRNHLGICPECVNDYETFIEKVFCEPELFDSTIARLGYAEPTDDFREGVSAKKVMSYDVCILQHWLLFGRRFTLDAISATGSLEGFVDECIRTFDLITESGF